MCFSKTLWIHPRILTLVLRILNLSFVLKAEDHLADGFAGVIYCVLGDHDFKRDCLLLSNINSTEPCSRCRCGRLLNSENVLGYWSLRVSLILKLWDRLRFLDYLILRLRNLCCCYTEASKAVVRFLFERWVDVYDQRWRPALHHLLQRDRLDAQSSLARLDARQAPWHRQGAWILSLRCIFLGAFYVRILILRLLMPQDLEFLLLLHSVIMICFSLSLFWWIPC